MTARARVCYFMEHAWFQNFIFGLIVANTTALGLWTADVFPALGDALWLASRVTLGFFVFELILRLYVYRLNFFRDPWLVFDLLTVGLAVLPSMWGFSVLRFLRVLRVLRLVSMESIRMSTQGLLSAMQGLVTGLPLIALLIFVAGVMGTILFGEFAPRYFGDLGSSLFTLFQIATGDDWGNIARTTMASSPQAWIFFIVYVVIVGLFAVNLVFGSLLQLVERPAGVADDFDLADETALRSLRDEIRALDHSLRTALEPHGRLPRTPDTSDEATTQPDQLALFDIDYGPESGDRYAAR